MTCPPLSIWIDDPPRVALRAGYLEELKSFGITHVAVMVQGMPRGARAQWKPKWSVRSLSRLGARLRRLGMELTVTIWPQPSPAGLILAMRESERLLRFCGADRLELDAESNWTPKKVRGYVNLAAASSAWSERLDELRRTYGVSVELTTFPAHRENSHRALLAPACDLLLPQAYAVRHRKRRGRTVLVGYDDRLGPKRVVRTTLKRTRQAAIASSSIGTRGRPARVGVGLALYDQRWPGHDPVDSLEEAFRRALAEAPEEIRFWSSKWAIGVRATDFGRRFLQRAAHIAAEVS